MNRLDPKTGEPLVAEFHAAPNSSDALAQITDCWNTIGVSGNASCRELEQFVHCRNCPVYSAAALKLLDRPITVEYRREWTEHFSQKKKLTSPAKTSVVIFRVGSEWLALPTTAFQEVAERRVIHSLPHRNRGLVLGLANVRGELLICVSLSRLLSLETAKSQPRSRTMFDRLLVASWDGSRLVFPVDEVHGIHRLYNEELRDPPATVARSSLGHTRSIFLWREHTIGLLDPDLIFTNLNRDLG